MTLYTLLIVPALAAAVVGKLISFPLTLLGGLAVELIQSETSLYVSTGGWAGASPFFVTIVVLVIRGGDRTLRTSIGSRLPGLGSGRLRARLVVPISVLSILVIHFLPVAWNDAVTTTVGTALILLSLISSPATAAAVPGAVRLRRMGSLDRHDPGGREGLPFLLAIVLGALDALPLGLLLGAGCLRMSGMNLAIATLGLAVALQNIVFSNPPLSDFGQFSVPSPGIGGVDVDAIQHSDRYAMVVLICFVLCAVAAGNLRRSRSGRRIIAVRASSAPRRRLVSASPVPGWPPLGPPTSLPASVALLLALRNPAVVFDDYSPLASIGLVTEAVVGGIGWIAGAVYGALLQGGSVVGHALDQPRGCAYLPLVAGVLVLVVLIIAPDGLAYQDWKRVEKLREWLHRPRKAEPIPDLPAATQGQRVRPQHLRIENLVVRFGGVMALDGVCLDVGPGQVVGLIGPNGAGKTTLVDVVTGYVNPTQGAVYLDDVRVSDYRPAKVAQHRLARSFQPVEVFDDKLCSTTSALPPRSIRHGVT